jgi:hypothetical protein
VGRLQRPHEVGSGKFLTGGLRAQHAARHIIRHDDLLVRQLRRSTTQHAYMASNFSSQNIKERALAFECSALAQRRRTCVVCSIDLVAEARRVRSVETENQGENSAGLYIRSPLFRIEVMMVFIIVDMGETTHLPRRNGIMLGSMEISVCSTTAMFTSGNFLWSSDAASQDILPLLLFY